MDNNSLHKPSPPKSITHIENEHFALWLSSHEPDLRCLAIQHSIFDVLQDMGITKNAILKAALTQISLCCKVDIKRIAPTTKKVHRPKIHSSEKLLHLKKNLHSDKECSTKTKVVDKCRHTIKNKIEKCKFQSKSNNSVNGSQISPDIGELTDEEKIKLLFVEGNIDNDCVITKDPLSVNKPENTTTVVLKRKAKSILNNIEMGAPVEKYKRRSKNHDTLKPPQNNNFLDSSKNSSHSYQLSQENKTKLGTYATSNKRDDEVIKFTKNWESPSKNIQVKKFVSTESTNPSKQNTELKEEEKFILTKSTKHYPSKRTTKLKDLEKFVATESTNNYPSKGAAEQKEAEKFVSTELKNPSKLKKLLSIKSTNNYPSKQTTKPREMEKFVSNESSNNYLSKSATEQKGDEKSVSTEFINPSKQPTKLKEMEKFILSESTNNYPSEQILPIIGKEMGKFVLTKSTKHSPSKQTTKLKEIEKFVPTESTNPSKQSSELKEEVLFVSTESANNYQSKQPTELNEVEKSLSTESTNLSNQSTQAKVYGYKRRLPNIDQETSDKCNSNNSRLLKKNRSKNSELLKSEERLQKDKSENKNVTENVKNVQESITDSEKSIINESPDVKNVEESNIGKIRVRDITTLMASPEPIKETSVLPLDVSNNKESKTFLEFKKTFFLSKPKIPKYILELFSRNDIRFMKLYTLKFNELVDSKIEIMGGLLHMGITDHLCKLERLKWADKLLSDKSIYIEKQRIEKECRDTMRQRGIEFSALFGSIVNKFEDDCVKEMFFALYARLVDTLLKIDVENEKHLLLSKNIIYNMLLKNNYTNKIVMGLFLGNNEVFKQSFSKFNSLIKFCNSFYTTEDGDVHKLDPNELECQQLTEGIFLNESKTLSINNNGFIIQEDQKNVKNNLYMMKDATCSITTNTPQPNDLINNSSNEDSGEVKDTSVLTVNQLEDCSDKVTDCSENDLNLKVTEVISIKDSTKLDHAYADKFQWINIISDNSEKENDIQNFKKPEEIETIDITDNEEVSTDKNCQSIEISEGERNSTHNSVSSAKVRNVGVVYPMGNNMLQTNTSNLFSYPGNTKVCATKQTNKINFTNLQKVIIKKDGINQVVQKFPKVIKLAPINYKLAPRFYKVHVPNRDGLSSSNVPQSLSFRKVNPYLDQTDKQSDTIIPTITRSQVMGLQTNGKIILTDKAIQNDAQTIPSPPFMHLSGTDEARKFCYFANNPSSSNVNNTDF